MLSSLGLNGQICKTEARRATFGEGPYFTLMIGDTRHSPTP